MLICAPALLVAQGSAGLLPGAPYLVGVGMADITGEAAGVGMFGYAQMQQRTAGIHQRLRARAFLLEEQASQRAVLVVVADLGAIMQGVHQEVMRRLKARYPGRYSEKNVMLTATHTHSGPGGFSHYTLYNLTVMGLQEATFNAMVDGIMEAIDRAHQHRAPGMVRLAQGELLTASRNRASAAFRANSAADRAIFPQEIDPLMSVLTFSHGQRDVGALTFFPSHATSMTNTNRLISGDHKGYAAWHWEHEVKGVRHLEQPDKPGFVSAFAQTTPGDMSPNLQLQPGRGPTNNEFDNTRIIGTRQFEKARQLSQDPRGVAISGPVDHRFRYVDMSRVEVKMPYTGDGQTHVTCPAALGSAFAAGSVEDGPGLSFVEEGKSNPWLTRLGHVLFSISDELQRCQAPKEVLIALGQDAHDTPWTPQVLPVQLLRLGPLALVGLPGEPTIVAGLKVRQQVAATLGLPDIRQVLVVGYANAYAGYITTPKEYDVQGYEGGSTHFGRWTLPAYVQQVDQLALAMRAGVPVPAGPQPRDLRGHTFDLLPGVLFDTPAWGHRFGDVIEPPATHYYAGQSVRAVFVTGHPGNDLRRQGTFLEVQRQVKGRWVRVADDGDWATIYRWHRTGVTTSTAQIEWQTLANTPPGTYRLVHLGNAKNWRGQITEFAGASPAFEVARR